MKKILLLNSFIVMALLLCSGCASVVSLATGPRAKVHLTSNPPGATVTILKNGNPVITTNTPAVVQLSRKQGYFAGAYYDVRFELPGYNPADTEIHANLNPWYVGNILVGGLIGLVIVDPLTGAMWSLSPHTINQNLVPVSQSMAPEQLKTADQSAGSAAKNVSAVSSGGTH